MLLLFDIDGTLLLKASRDHVLAIHAALRRVHRLQEIPAGKLDAAGRTDPAIARTLLTLVDVSAEEIDARAHDVMLAACAEYQQRCPADLREHVAPGVPEVLDKLAARDDVKLSVLTGNLECVARLKLERAGLSDYFEYGQGAFGSDSEDRSELPEIARRRAGDHPREQTVVIGDTPRDIACARADGVHCIAIATGPYRAADLHGADVVIDMAREIPAALARIPGLV
ncbi:Phosphoglycolate phosphatase [Baekduia alba]|uniref:HAD family hydrolase n=1 Tax=Baekduia alba TaxID=2997333 RepID=UPI002341AF8C|nr:haloacid dehalogenase-like hydrolase [Baekduia alba]WCB91910.1 Phosphoglycolate phosphatase [Baekduia alba]